MQILRSAVRVQTIADSRHAAPVLGYDACIKRSAGNGVANHLAMELFRQMTGVNIVHVPYKGAPQAVSDVLAGHMNMMFKSIAPIVAHIKAGRVRALGIASAKRSQQLPDIPTIGEAGVPGFVAEDWFGMFAPAKTPKQNIARINEALVKVVRTRSRCAA